MTPVVLDAAAILAVLFDERGAEQVAPALDDAHACSINVSEAFTKLLDRQIDAGDTLDLVLGLRLTIHDFDVSQALEVARLRAKTKPFGLSLGDRSCLALASKLNLPILTADRRMADARDAVGLDIRLIR